MHEEKREIITKEMILEKYKKSNVPMYIISIVVLLIVAAVFGFGMSSLFKGIAQEGGAERTPMYILLGLVLIGIVGYVTYRVIRMFIGLFKGIHDIRNEDIIISHAKFDKHVVFDGPRTPFSGGYDTVYFQDGKRYTIHRNTDGSVVYPSRLETALQLSEYGDSYIVVCMASEPDKIVELYCEKFYTYRE